MYVVSFLLYIVFACEVCTVMVNNNNNYTKYNDTKFITHENFQLSSFQKCAKFIHMKIFAYMVCDRLCENQSHFKTGSMQLIKGMGLILFILIIKKHLTQFCTSDFCIN